MLLNNQQVMEEIKKEIKLCIEINENMTAQSLLDSAKSRAKRKFIAIQVFLKRSIK